MNKKLQQTIQGQRRRRVARVRAKVKGSEKRPRLSVFRSSGRISAQLIDDNAGRTIAAVNQDELKKKVKNVEAAQKLGALMGEKAKKAGIKEVVFDRRHYKYHGRVKAFADAVREAGIKF